MKEQHIIVVGNITDGIYFHGPFEDRDEAVEYAERECNTDWHITQLTPVPPHRYQVHAYPEQDGTMRWTYVDPYAKESVLSYPTEDDALDAAWTEFNAKQ